MTDVLDRTARVVREPRYRHWWYAGFRPLLLRLHFYVGLFVGPFILVAALSGLAYTLTPALEHVVHHDELHVQVGIRRLPIADQVAAGQDRVPGGTLVEVRPPAGPDGTIRVSFTTPNLDSQHSRTVFVDPYTGQVRGVLTTFGEWLPLRAWVDTLHRTLFLGDAGRIYSELAASWLWVLGFSGIGLWAVRVKTRRRARRVLVPQTCGSRRTRLRSWHGAVGVWAIVGVLFLSATGLTWSHYAGGHFSALTQQLNWSTPTPQTTLPAGSPTVTVPSRGQGAATARVLAAGRAAGLTDPIAVDVGEPGQAWTISEVKRSWPERHDSLAVDPATGNVLNRVDFTDWPFISKLAQWGVDAHMGLLFGTANIAVLAVLALGIVCLTVWGYRMWWLRRPTKMSAPTATTQAPMSAKFATSLGDQRRPSLVAVLTVAGIGIVVGVAFPVLGGSLLVFLAGDTIRQILRPEAITRDS